MTDFKRKDEVFTLGNIMMKQVLYQYSMAQRVLLLLIILKRFDELLSETDANGNMITQTSPLGTTTFEYDGMNRVTKITDPQGHATTNTYDKMGNLITVKDANNNTTTYEYNYKEQVTKVTDALNNQTTYNYSGTRRDEGSGLNL